MRYWHIDRKINIRTDEEAQAALAKENDRDFLSENSGIIRVPVERWNVAQAAERTHWMVLRLRSSNDRNDQHFVRFDGYKAIRGLRFESAIELGCGPFTNLRLIGNVCQVKECTLLDPLIESYLNHPNCFYTRNFLSVQSEREPTFLRRIRNWFAWRFPPMHNIIRRYYRKIPIKQIMASPIELMPTNNEYDLVVLINVIEHCYDIDAVFKNIISIMKKDAFIVFHETYYNHDSVAENVKYQYDAAHTLKIDRGLIDAFLEENFKPVYKRVYTYHSSWLRESFSTDSIYFIGKICKNST